MALLKIALTPDQMVYAAGGIRFSVEHMRDHLRKSDKEYGKFNDVNRQALKHRKAAHAEMMVVLRTAGYPMVGADITDEPIDRAPL